MNSWKHITSTQALKSLQGSVTPGLRCDGLAFQKQDLDIVMGSAMLSLQRQSERN